MLKSIAFAVRVEKRGKSSLAGGKPCSPVNPIRSNINYGNTRPTCRERWREPYGNIRPRKMVVQDRTRLIDSVAKKASGFADAFSFYLINNAQWFFNTDKIASRFNIFAINLKGYNSIGILVCAKKNIINNINISWSLAAATCEGGV